MAENGLLALLKTLTGIQIEFVSARLTTKSDKAAAEAIGISPITVYKWPNKPIVNQVLRLAALNSLEVARERLSRLTLKAVGVLDKEMDGDKPLPPACEVLDRAGLAAKRELDVTTGGRRLDARYTDEQRKALILDVLAAYGIKIDTGPESDLAAIDGAAERSLPL